jgi:hypothetical protein
LASDEGGNESELPTRQRLGNVTNVIGIDTVLESNDTMTVSVPFVIDIHQRRSARQEKALLLILRDAATGPSVRRLQVR